jgi:kinesin family protein 5
LSDVPKKILNGIDCTVLAYGQTGTGKTHTMMGEGQGVEMIVRASGGDNNINSVPEETLDPKKNPQLTEGMTARTVSDIFSEIQKLPKSIHCTVRCSYVEIYVEKIFDLLQPSSKEIYLTEGEDGEYSLIGASELCCLEPQDVYSVLARGNAYRTMSATKQNQDFSRSHAVLSLKVEQIDRSNGTHLSSRLLMLDLAGSEQGRSKSSRQTDSPLTMEGRMVNGSLQSLYNTIRTELVKQGKKERVNPNAFSYVSKLTKLLRSSIGGNCYTSCICTASPSSYSIGETVSTIKYGQKLRSLKNFPIPRKALSLNDYRARLEKAEKNEANLTRLMKVLAKECQTLKDTSRAKQSDQVWEGISKIAASGKGESGSDLKISVSTGEDESNNYNKSDARDVEGQLKEYKAAREKAEMAMRDYQSEVVSLRSEKEVMMKERKRIEQELSDAKREIASLSSRTEELESVVQTSQFREKEAVLFLRQFRSFYLRLMKNKAAQGNGDTRQTMEETSKKIPGVPDLEDIIDIDKLMVDSGLIEKSEAGEDTNAPDYTPSEEALAQSKKEAEAAEQKEMALMEKMFGLDDPSLRSLSVVKRPEPGQLITYRQKLVETPAAKLAMQKESEMENQLIELSSKCAGLQNAVNAEKAMVEALSARQGALGKMKSAQEMNTLRSELERKSNDLQAIVWKMNELHLVNKTVTEKVESREHHLTYLEEHLIDLQTRNRRLVIERQEGEKRLQEDNSEIQQQLDGMRVKLWQLGEASPEKSAYRKLVLSCGGEAVDLQSKPGHKRQIENLADEAAKLLEIIPQEDEEEMNEFLAAVKGGPITKPEATKTRETSPKPLLNVRARSKSPVPEKTSKTTESSVTKSPPRSPQRPPKAVAATPDEPKAAEVKEMKQAEVEETKKETPDEPKSAELEETKKAEVEETKRAEVKETRKVEAKETKKEESETTAPEPEPAAGQETPNTQRVSGFRARMAMFEKGGSAQPTVPPAFSSTSRASTKFRIPAAQDPKSLEWMGKARKLKKGAPEEQTDRDEQDS